ncbi:MAG: phosphoribosylformylglycinamidine cyclo-ligase [bacterium]|nr:phosphoribosylformylglycinamidine cyclo-ligase [bacterium]
MSEKKLTYRDAGVDIDAGNEAVERIKKILKSSSRIVPGGEEVGGIGGFSGLFRPKLGNYRNPLLVASTDSVGTKILIAIQHKILEGIGQDCVAMCVNDVIVGGARPLFFLDYIGTGHISPDEIEILVGSINRACEESDCLLIGGEIAEISTMYDPGQTDLAGFVVGIVDSDRVIDGHDVKPGDTLLGIASSGIHSNGFSLVRKLMEMGTWELESPLSGSEKPLIREILEPTRLYVRPLLKLIDELGAGVKACAHITGGGLLENIIRSMPAGLGVRIDHTTWQRQLVFHLIQQTAQLPDNEMYRTFNCGIGFTVIVSPWDAERAVNILEGAGEKVYKIGEVVERRGDQPGVVII